MAELEPDFILTIYNAKAEPVLLLKFPTGHIRGIDDAMRVAESVERLGGHATIRNYIEPCGNNKEQAKGGRG